MLLPTLISSFFTKGDLRFLHVKKIVELTRDHGTAPETAYGVAQIEAGLRWLNRPQPDPGEVSSRLENTRKSGRRAADTITALRALVKQEPSP